MSPVTAHLYGHHTADEQEKSPTCQIDMGLAKLDDLNARSGGERFVLGEVVIEHESSPSFTWKQRPRLARLLRRMNSGDALIVWRLDRLDPRPLQQLDVVRHLIERNLRLIVLEHLDDLQIDLETREGRRQIVLLAKLADQWDAQRAKITQQALGQRKRNGLVYSRHVPYGHRRIQHKRRKVDVLDRDECVQIAEIVRRRRGGESFQSIARDFERRGLKRACGEPWATRYGRGLRSPESHRLSDSRLRSAYAWAEQQLARTGTIGGVGEGIGARC